MTSDVKIYWGGVELLGWTRKWYSYHNFKGELALQFPIDSEVACLLRMCRCRKNILTIEKDNGSIVNHVANLAPYTTFDNINEFLFFFWDECGANAT